MVKVLDKTAVQAGEYANADIVSWSNFSSHSSSPFYFETGSNSLSFISLRNCSLVQVLLGVTIGVSLTLFATGFDIRSYGSKPVKTGKISSKLDLN